MNPLSPFTYYRRHKGRALLLLVLMGSLTLGTFAPNGVTLTRVEMSHHRRHHLTRVSRIVAGEALDPGTVAQLRVHPDVAAVLPENGLTVNIPTSTGVPDLFSVLGVAEGDLASVMEACDLRLREGRLIEPRAAEIMLSEQVVRALGLQIGDVIGREIDEDFYPTVMTELTLVGILESVPSTTNETFALRASPSEAGAEVQLGFVSYEYLAGHEADQPRLSNLLITPRPGRRVAMNDAAMALIDGSCATTSVRLETFERETETMRRLTKVLYGMYILGGGVLSISIALVVGMVNRIAIAHRLPELGLLHAAGYEKRSLIRRLVLEIVVITGIGWASGLLLSVTSAALLNSTRLAAAGPFIDLSIPVPFLLTLPAPLAVVGWVTVSVRGVLNRLDTVAIVERGKLSMEDAKGRKEDARSRKQGKVRSSRNPLSSWTFYRRHRRRGLALLFSTGLMVLGIAFPAFISTFMLDSVWPLGLSYTSHAGVVSPAPTYQAVDPAILAQIRGHPAVAHVIPVRGLTMMVNVIPFEFPLSVLAVRKDDLPMLLDAYGLHVEEGHLPQPRSGQIVLTGALARNRGLRVGDTVGRSIHELDSMPTEMTVVGLLDSTAPGLAEREGIRVPQVPRWVAFVSYEFVERHERYTAAQMAALVVPVEGRETEMEAWLEQSIDSPQVTVETFGTAYHSFRKTTQTLMLFLAMTETFVTAVLTLALAILNTIFVNQRRDEFGILHAGGHSRAGLIGRTLRGNVGIAGAAWLIGATCCLILLLGAQASVYAPRGMSVDWSNPTPWLFTLPLPVAVIAASAGAIWWALSRLDPVAVIERR